MERGELTTFMSWEKTRWIRKLTAIRAGETTRRAEIPGGAGSFLHQHGANGRCRSCRVSAGWCETEGTVTNSERRVQRVRAAVPLPEGVRDDIGDHF